MSHFLSIRTNENGIVTDLNLDVEIQIASQSPFAFTDVFIYSHGWWTSDNDASADYNEFSIGFAIPAGPGPQNARCRPSTPTSSCPKSMS